MHQSLALGGSITHFGEQIVYVELGIACFSVFLFLVYYLVLICLHFFFSLTGVLEKEFIIQIGLRVLSEAQLGFGDLEDVTVLNPKSFLFRAYG